MTNIACFMTSAARLAKLRGHANTFQIRLDTMKKPDLDLFEISLDHAGQEIRTFAQIIDRRNETFVIAFDAPLKNLTMSIIGSDFPDHMKARPIGSLGPYLERYSDQTQSVLNVFAAQGEYDEGNIEVARAVDHMVQAGSDAITAVTHAKAVTARCATFLQQTATRAAEARTAMLKTA